LTSTILINETQYQTRVAYINNGVFWEYFQQKQQQNSLVGNIYKGKVLRVLPGLQSAFIDIGQEKAAFLHITDLLEQHLNDVDEDGKEESINNPDIDISKMLTQGEEIIVQVIKDPISTKGPRVTTWLSIPGRYLVFFPIGNKVGVSKKIESETERKRLKDIVENIKPLDTTFIIRTAAENTTEEILKNDMEIALRFWIDIVKKQKNVQAPFTLFEDLSLPLKITRDLLNDEVDEMIIDDKKIYSSIVYFAENFLPTQKHKISYYNEETPLFKKFEIENIIDQLFCKAVPLKSGGNIIIEQVEAMTIVDVNTGSFVGKNLEHSDTILRTNKEAMTVLAEQLRLRNIGGIIIVDFIDMKSESDKEKLIKHAETVTQKDRAKVLIHGITSLGLMQITRKRISDSIKRTLTIECPVCNGFGYIKNENLFHNIYKDIIKYDVNILKNSTINIYVHSSIAKYLTEEESDNLKILEKKFTAKVKIHSDGNLIPSIHKIVIS